MRRAEALYEGAIAADPTFALAHAQLAFLIMEMYWRSIDTAPERLDRARASAMRALELEPNLPQAHLALGYLHYWGHKDYPAALAEFAAARESLPNDARCSKAIAYVYRRQGRLADAVPELERATVLDPRDATSFLNLSMTLGFLRRYGEAEAALNRALALSPDSIESRVYLAFMLLNDDRPADAEAALAVVPSDVDPRGFVSHVRYHLATFRRQPDAALAALARAPDRLDDPVGNELVSAAVLRGQALAAKGDGGAARAAFEAARLALEVDRRTAREPSEIESQLAVAYAGLGRKSEALEAGRHALSLRPFEQDAMAATANLCRMAQVETMVGDAQPAIDHLEQLMALPAGLTLSAATLRSMPTWDPLRGEPRFAELIATADAAAAAIHSKARAP
jgi:tetratricopeptide (TPR) repeat protein